MTVDMNIPTEPADRTVVLDRESYAWQRRGGRWYSVKPSTLGVADSVLSLTWEYLLVDRKPLTPMIATSAIDDYLADDVKDSDGWRRAGYTDPSCEHYRQPTGVSRAFPAGDDGYYCE